MLRKMIAFVLFLRISFFDFQAPYIIPRGTIMNKKTLALSGISILLSLLLSSCKTTDVTKSDLNIKSIAVDSASMPAKIGVGQFDQAGIRLLITYSDGTSEYVAVNSSMVPSEYQSYLTTPGQYTVSILFRGQETSIVVNIVSIYTVSFSAYKENTPTLVVVAKKSVLDGDGATAPSEFSTNFIAARLHYRFTSWDADFSAVTADLAVTAVYSTIAVYQVNFYDGNLKAISTQWIDKGADAVEPTETERAVAGYVFVGWDRSYKAVIKDLEIYGIYYKVTVK